jgi:hypothetical protein
MSSIGFGNSGKDNGEQYKGNSSEDFVHTIKLFGLTVFKATKVHSTTTNTEGRNPNR